MQLKCVIRSPSYVYSEEGLAAEATTFSTMDSHTAYGRTDLAVENSSKRVWALRDKLYH